MTAAFCLELCESYKKLLIIIFPALDKPGRFSFVILKDVGKNVSRGDMMQTFVADLESYSIEEVINHLEEFLQIVSQFYKDLFVIDSPLTKERVDKIIAAMHEKKCVFTEDLFGADLKPRSK